MKKILFALLSVVLLAGCQSKISNYTEALPDDAVVLAVFNTPKMPWSELQSKVGDDAREFYEQMDYTQKSYAFVTPDGVAGALFAVKDAKAAAEATGEEYTEENGIYMLNIDKALLCMKDNRALTIFSADGDCASIAAQLLNKDTRPEEMLAKVEGNDNLVSVYGNGSDIKELIADFYPSALSSLPIDIAGYNLSLNVVADGCKASTIFDMTDGDQDGLATLATQLDGMIAMFTPMMGRNAVKVEGRTLTFDVKALTKMAGRSKSAEQAQNIKSASFVYDDNGHFQFDIETETPVDELLKELVK